MTKYAAHEIVRHFEKILSHDTTRRFSVGAKEIEVIRFPGGGYVVNDKANQHSTRGTLHFDRYGEIKRINESTDANALLDSIFSQAPEGSK